MIIVGGQAAKHFNINLREPSDTDIWHSPSKDYAKGSGEDVHLIPEEILTLVPSVNGYATPDALYTIKMSHLGWDNAMWNKHKNDLLHFKHKGCNVIADLYQELLSFWKTELGDKDFLSLDQDKEKFFTDEVDYKYDHDLLHEMASYPELPIYTKCLKEGKQVLIDKAKFDKLEFKDQIRMFKEEVSVICFERWVIPHSKSWVEAYPWAVRKTVTTLTKGWATDFLLRNLDEFIKPDKQVIQNLINFINTQEENNMSNKADLSVFEGMYNDLASDLGKDQFFYEIFNGDLDEVGYDSGLGWKESREARDAKLKVHDYEHVTSEGGGEGEGEYCYGIIKFKGKHYKAEWQYYSYNGCEYDDIESSIVEVTPKQKTVTVFE